MEATTMTQPPRNKGGRPKGSTKKRIKDMTPEELAAKQAEIDGKDFLSAEEVALRLNFTPDYIRRLAQQRRIKFCKIGTRLRFDKAEVDEFKRKNTYEVDNTDKQSLADTYDATKKALA